MYTLNCVKRGSLIDSYVGAYLRIKQLKVF